MIAVAYRVLHEVDPTIIVVSPALSSGDPVASRVLENLRKFAAAGIYRYCDVIAYHAYLVPERPDHSTVPPEAIFARTNLVRALLRTYQVPDKPMWDTEIGWEMLNDDANTSRVASYLGDPLTPALASGFVARTYLLGWAAGWQRIYWYSWNAGGTTLTEENGGYKICEGAYNAVHDWTVGNRFVAIDRHKDGTWIVSLRSPADKPSWSSGTRVSAVTSASPPPGMRPLPLIWQAPKHPSQARPTSARCPFCFNKLQLASPFTLKCG